MKKAENASFYIFSHKKQLPVPVLNPRYRQLFFIDPTVSAPRVHGCSVSDGAGAGPASSDSVCADASFFGASPATLCVRR